LQYKSSPLDLVMEEIDPFWKEIDAQISSDQRNTLRPLSTREVAAIDSDLIEFGAHSHTHCILRNESWKRREEEILTSIAKVAQWTGRPVRLFAYPNGQRGDFGESDKDLLRAQGIVAAVSGIKGANGPHADPLELRRYPVGLFHDMDGFRAEISGFRATVLSAL